MASGLETQEHLVLFHHLPCLPCRYLVHMQGAEYMVLRLVCEVLRQNFVL